MACSIFIASITISTSPAETLCPTATGTATTTPGSGVVSPPVAALGENSCVRGSSSTSSYGSSAVHRYTRTHERSEEHTSELQSQSNLVCRLLLEKKKNLNHYQQSHSRMLYV